MAGSVPFLAMGQTLPIQLRVARSHSKVAVNVPFHTQRPPTYGGYSPVSMEKAYEAVAAGKMSVRKAADEYGVPRSTLHDRVTGRVALKARSGVKRHLSDEEEASLVEYLIGCASVGYAKSGKDVLAIAQQMASTRDPKVEITRGWWDSFRARHPEVTLRRAEPLSYARATASSPDTINNYFDLLEQTIEANSLSQRPGQIFNCDETGMPLSHKPPKVLAHVGQKHPYAVTSGDRSQITILACASASGYSIPPMVVYDRKSLQPDMTEGEVPGTFYSLSESGWMNAELFEEWFKHHFLVHAPSIRPLLLLLDGHTSHYNPSFLKLAAKEGIIVFCLPPHTTHLLQPLDNGVFSSLKHHWGKECQRFHAKNLGKVLNCCNFMAVFSKAWVEGMAISNVVSCFRAVGVYPVNRRVALAQATHESSSLQCAPTPFVPFCTPQKGVATDAPPTGTTLTDATPVDTHDSVSVQPPQPLTFTAAEVEQFQTRLLESTDARYALWLQTFYPQVNARAPQGQGVMDRFLQRPPPPPRQRVRNYPQSAHVLTSEQCIRRLEEKAEEKKKKQEEKETKMKERERKRQEKAMQKAGKKTKKGKSTVTSW